MTRHRLRKGTVTVALALLIAKTSFADSIALTDRTDLAIVDSTTSTRAVGYEPFVAVDPSNWRILLVSHYGEDGCVKWISTNGGTKWHGSNSSPHSPGSGDATTVILAAQDTFPKRYLVQSIGTKDSDPVVAFQDLSPQVFRSIPPWSSIGTAM